MLFNCVELTFRTALSAAGQSSLACANVHSRRLNRAVVEFRLPHHRFLELGEQTSSSTAPPSDLLNFALGLAISFSTDDGGPYGDAAKEYFAAQANRDQSSQFHGRLPPSSKSGFSCRLELSLDPSGKHIAHQLLQHCTGRRNYLKGSAQLGSAQFSMKKWLSPASSVNAVSESPFKTRPTIAESTS